MRKIVLLFLLIMSLMVLCACGTDEVPSAPTPTPTPTPVVTPTPEPTPMPPAERVEGIRVFAGGERHNPSLSDGNYYSRKYLSGTGELRVESDTPFGALYISWDAVPGAYQVEWDGGAVSCGQHDFLHEYVRLPETVTSVRFVFPEERTRILCDVEAYTLGSPPEGVQEWLPPCDQADILVFPTHSDDEALFFGPLIAYYTIQRELTVQTAFMVEHTGYPERSHERLNGLWELGVRHYPILGTAPDTASTNFHECMQYYAKSAIDAWQTELIRRFRPLVVVGHDLDGEYGNGGHKINAYYLTQAIEAAADPAQYPDSAETYGVWDTPKYYIHLYEENSIVMDVDAPMTNDENGRSPFEAASEAYEQYPSQHRWFRGLYKEEQPKYDCRPFGLYRSLVGADTTTDLMENIDTELWRTKQMGT